MGFFDKLKKITTNLFSGFSEADEAFFEELEETLILADLGMDTALDAVEKLRTRVRKEKLQDQEAVKAALPGHSGRRRWTWAARSWISRPGLLWCCSSASTA